MEPEVGTNGSLAGLLNRAPATTKQAVEGRGESLEGSHGVGF